MCVEKTKELIEWCHKISRGCETSFVCMQPFEEGAHEYYIVTKKYFESFLKKEIKIKVGEILIMRKIEVKEWDHEDKPTLPATKYKYKEAIFHQWGSTYKEIGSKGIGHYPIAIVEYPEGTVESVPIENIKFLDKPEESEYYVQWNGNKFVTMPGGKEIKGEVKISKLCEVGGEIYGVGEPTNKEKITKLCKEIGEATTVGELRKLLNKYDDNTDFGFLNQPIQQLYELKDKDTISVVFQ